ncbi:MAG: hypothetical protein AAF623_00675 [Planctomycetota bacterium]
MNSLQVLSKFCYQRLALACLILSCSYTIGCQNDSDPQISSSSKGAETQSVGTSSQRVVAKKIPVGAAPTTAGQPNPKVKTAGIRDQADANANRVQRVVTKKPPVLERDGVTYFPAQVNKVNTILVMAYQSDIRADYVIVNTRFVMKEDQILEAKKLVQEYDWQFDEIMEKRHQFLETVDSETDLELGLLDIRMDIADLISKIRQRIHREILNEEQQQILMDKYRKPAT